MTRQDFDRQMVEGMVAGLTLSIEKYRGLANLARKVGRVDLAVICEDLQLATERARERAVLAAPGAN